MCSHLPLPFYLNLSLLSFSFHFNHPVSEKPISSQVDLPQARRWRRQEELTLSGRGCAKAPLPLPGPPHQAPSSAAAGPSTVGPSVAGPSAAGPSVAAAGADPSVPAVRPSVEAASPAPAAIQSPAAGDAEGSSSVAPTHKRYHTRVGPTPPAPSHPRPARRAPLAKKARTSGPGESSTSRSRAPPSPPYQGIPGASDLSPASIIRRPYFPCDPIPGNVSCRGRDFHGEVYYDLSAFSADPRL